MERASRLIGKLTGPIDVDIELRIVQCLRDLHVGGLAGDYGPMVGP